MEEGEEYSDGWSNAERERAQATVTLHADPTRVLVGAFDADVQQQQSWRRADGRHQRSDLLEELVKEQRLRSCHAEEYERRVPLCRQSKQWVIG